MKSVMKISQLALASFTLCILAMGASASAATASAADCASIPMKIQNISHAVHHMATVSSDTFKSDAKSTGDWCTGMAQYEGKGCIAMPAGWLDSFRANVVTQNKNAQDITDYDNVIQKRIEKLELLVQACTK